MGTKVKSTSLDTQTYITAVSGGATLRGNWYIGTSGLGSGGANPGTLNGPLNGNATSADKWSSKVVVNGTDLDGATTPVTIKVNTTSNPASGTYYPVFVPSSSASNQQASTSSSTGLTFNPSTNDLSITGTMTANTFSGSGASLTNIVKSISFNGGSAQYGNVSITQSSYGLSAIDGANSSPKIRLYQSDTSGTAVTFNSNTAVSYGRILVSLGALDAGETALRAVLNATNPSTGQPYGDLSGSGTIDQSDQIIILQLVAGTASPTSRSNQLLTAIAASASLSSMVIYGWINISNAADVTLTGGGGTTLTRSGNTITISSSVDLSSYAPLASPNFTGTVGTQNLTVSSQGNGTSYALSLANGTYKWANTINSSNNLAWNAIYVGTDYGSKMVLKPSGDLSIDGAYYGDGSHLTGISQPTNVSQLTNDSNYSSIINGTFNSIQGGMGAVPGYTYTVASSGFDDTSVTWNVPSSGYWTFISLNLYVTGQRYACSPWLNTAAYIHVYFELYDGLTSSWFPISVKTWDYNVVSTGAADGNIRLWTATSAYFQGGLGWGGSTLSDKQYEKPYYLDAGAHIRLRVIWSPNLSDAINDPQSGRTSGQMLTQPLGSPMTQSGTTGFQWRCYPSPISASAYWYMGGGASFTAVKSGA